MVQVHVGLATWKFFLSHGGSHLGRKCLIYCRVVALGELWACWSLLFVPDVVGEEEEIVSQVFWLLRGRNSSVAVRTMLLFMLFFG